MKAKLEHRVQTFWNNVLALCLGLELGPLTFHDLKELAYDYLIMETKMSQDLQQAEHPGELMA